MKQPYDGDFLISFSRNTVFIESCNLEKVECDGGNTNYASFSAAIAADLVVCPRHVRLRHSP